MLLEKGVSGLRSWTGREFHGCGPAAAKVLSPKLAVVMTWHLLTAAVCGGFVAGCPPTGRAISIRGAPVIGRYSVSAIWADADNQPIFIPFHRRARRTSAAGAELMGKCFSVVRCQNSGTVRAGPNRTLEFL